MIRRSPALEFALSALLALVLVVLATVVVARRDLRVDLTVGERRTLTAQTRAVLDLVERPVEIVAFYQDVPQEKQRVRELVERYRGFNDLLELDFVDLDRRPDLAEVYGVTVNRTVLLIDGDLRVRTVDPDEAELTSALLRLVRSDPPVVMFVAGHGESSLEDDGPGGWQGVVELLGQQNFDLRILSTAAVRRIPAETDLVVLAGPQTALQPREQGVILDHVLRGGSVLAMLEPFGSASADSLVRRFGVLAEPGFLVDISPEQVNLTNGGDPRIVLAIGGESTHPVTRGFTYNTLFPLARALRAVQPPPPGVRATRLLVTQPETWIESDPTQIGRGRPQYDPGSDRAGPFPLAFAVEIDLPSFEIAPDDTIGIDRTMLEMWGMVADRRDPALADTLEVGDLQIATELADRARLVVLGDADFASNANLRVQGNGDLLLSAVLWLTEQEDRIVLPDGRDVNDPVVLEARQLAAYRWTGVVAVPLLFFAVGAFLLHRRSRWL